MRNLQVKVQALFVAFESRFCGGLAARVYLYYAIHLAELVVPDRPIRPHPVAIQTVHNISFSAAVRGPHLKSDNWK